MPQGRFRVLCAAAKSGRGQIYNKYMVFKKSSSLDLEEIWDLLIICTAVIVQSLRKSRVPQGDDRRTEGAQGQNLGCCLHLCSMWKKRNREEHWDRMDRKIENEGSLVSPWFQAAMIYGIKLGLYGNISSMALCAPKSHIAWRVLGWAFHCSFTCSWWNIHLAQRLRTCC